MSQQPVSNQGGVLYVVATPIGNLDDLSPRAVQVLRSVHRIAAEDTRHTRRLLQHHGIETPMVPLHEHNEKRVLQQVIDWLRKGKPVALVSDAGTPLISDPGFPLVRECRQRGLRVSPVPGPSALVAALSVSGLPTDRFCFHGFLPRQQAARRARLQSLRDIDATLVFYESAHRIDGSLRDMAEVLGAQRNACVARELTKRHEEILSGTLEELAERFAADAGRRRGEFVVMVAPAEASAGERLAGPTERLLEILLDELPLKQAVALAARISGESRNRLYRWALEKAG
jgi:16S rRNA (cytidine1402-2'-O)-methyltransferase